MVLARNQDFPGGTKRKGFGSPSRGSPPRRSRRLSPPAHTGSPPAHTGMATRSTPTKGILKAPVYSLARPAMATCRSSNADKAEAEVAAETDKARATDVVSNEAGADSAEVEEPN